MNATKCTDIVTSLFPPSSQPYGVSLSGWCARWWHWLLSIPKYVNPVVDETGEFSSQFQNDPNVWYLAGTFGGSVVRRCNVPKGKAIIFPVINYEASLADEPDLSDPKQLEIKCKQEIDNIGRLYCYVDGQIIDLAQYRIACRAFKIEIPSDNCLSVKSGQTSMASDGYWLFLQPLPRGKHVIQSFGSCLAGKIKIGCDYRLIVQ